MPEPGRQLDEHTARILHAAAEGIYALDLGGRVTFVNPAGERLTGWAREEQLGRCHHALLHHTRSDGSPYPPDACPIQATLADGQPRQGEDEIFWRRDGTPFPAAFSCAPMHDDAGERIGAVVTLSDMSHRLSERRYRSLVMATSDFVWRCTADGSLVDISEQWLALVGRTLSEISGWKWLSVVHPDDRALYERAWQQAVASEAVFEHAYRLCCHDGDIRWFHDRAVPVFDDRGQLIDWVGAGRDITEQKRAEQELRDSEARFRAIATNLPGGVSRRVMDPDGCIRFEYLSPNFEPVFGISTEQALSDSSVMQDVIHPDDRPRYRSALLHSARTGSPLDVEFRIHNRRGETRWVRSLGAPRRRDNGAVVWDGLSIDETPRKRAEERLHESQALLEIAGRTARLGGWAADLASDRVTWSEEVCAIHDMPTGSAPTLDECMQFYAPAWRTRAWEAFQACAHEGLAYDEEMEIITRGSRRVWVRVIGEPVRDAAGRIVEVRGALQDVSEQKRAQEEVRRLADRLTNTLESITDAFYTLDHQWRFTYLNGEAERLLRRDREELLGRNIWHELDTARGSALETNYRWAMRERRTARFEFHHPATAAWFELHAYPSDEGLAVYFRDITERKRAQREIEFLATYDPLTELPNRRLLLERLQSALDAMSSSGRHGAVMFLDLDDFKTLNDTLGHDMGDRLLQRVADRLSASTRASDTVARFGGDEFAVILNDLDPDTREAGADALRIGEEVKASLSQPYRLGEHERYTSVSIGITMIHDTRDTPEEVMKRADLAMYQAKNAGRSAVRIFDPVMREAVHARVALQTALHEGLANGLIVPWYQPQVDSHGRLIGAEALARWRDPERGHISPAEFVAAAEDSGLIWPLGEAILDRVCTALARWAAHPALAGLTVAVNVSARQFHHPDFVDQVRTVLARTGAPPHRLGLELTESLLLADVDDTISKMATLKHLGVRFALDDFGTGYSSLSYLKRLPFDQLKIEQGFVQNALNDRNDAAIVDTIITLAQTLGLEVIAEGVETEPVRTLLARYGCGAYQGYLFGRPMPIEDFERFACVRNGDEQA